MSSLDPRNKCSNCGTQLTGAYPGAFEPVVCYSCRLKALEPAQRTQPKEYEVRVSIPGSRWKIVHNTPDDIKGGIQKVYFVNRGPFSLSCSCPSGRYHGHCKHARYVANMIGQPALAEPANLTEF